MHSHRSPATSSSRDALLSRDTILGSGCGPEPPSIIIFRDHHSPLNRANDQIKGSYIGRLVTRASQPKKEKTLTLGDEFDFSASVMSDDYDSEDSDFSSTSSDSNSDSSDEWSDYEDESWIKDDDAVAILNARYKKKRNGRRRSRTRSNNRRRVAQSSGPTPNSTIPITTEQQEQTQQRKGKERDEESGSEHEDGKYVVHKRKQLATLIVDREHVISARKPPSPISDRIRGSVALNRPDPVRRSRSDCSNDGSYSPDFYDTLDSLLQQQQQQNTKSGKGPNPLRRSPSASPDGSSIPEGRKRNKLSFYVRGWLSSPKLDSHSAVRDECLHQSAPTTPGSISEILLRPPTMPLHSSTPEASPKSQNAVAFSGDNKTRRNTTITTPTRSPNGSGIQPSGKKTKDRITSASITTTTTTTTVTSADVSDSNNKSQKPLKTQRRKKGGSGRTSSSRALVTVMVANTSADC